MATEGPGDTLLLTLKVEGGRELGKEGGTPGKLVEAGKGTETGPPPACPLRDAGLLAWILAQ